MKPRPPAWMLTADDDPIFHRLRDPEVSMPVPETVYCVMDYETFSEADIGEVGAYEYSLHPSTEILCVAWRIGTRDQLRTAETKWWCPYLDGGDFAAFYEVITDPTTVLVAHNVFFEQVITRNVFAKRLMYSKEDLISSMIGPERWACTAAMAAAHALPRSLDGACSALLLPHQKDDKGHRHMLKVSQPRKPSKNDPATRHTSPADMQRLLEYCIKDIAAEVELFLTLPLLGRSHLDERKVWELDQRINLRGFEVDRPLVQTIMGMLEQENARLLAEVETITSGAVKSTRQVAKTLEWLSEQGCHLTDLRADTVDAVIKEGMADGAALDLLMVRRQLSKTSTAKYKPFEASSRSDGRLRDSLRYHAASTGRWGGMRVQPQNFPRGKLKAEDIPGIIETVRGGDIEEIRDWYGNPMELFSDLLRSMIIAPEGKVLDVADYNAIEPRVTFWLANHEKGLDSFRKGKPYEALASVVFGIPIEEVNTDQRWLGKQGVIGAGYGMGPPRFQGHCSDNGREISLELAETTIRSYRTANRPVVELWREMEAAAKAAVKNPGQEFHAAHGKVRWTYDHTKGFLYCVLPSGRRLAYCDPSIERENHPKFGPKEVLYHWGVDSMTKQWVREKTWGGTLVENVVQAISRDLMADAMLRIEATGNWEIVLTVHDELAAERDEWAPVVWNDYKMLLEAVPAWAKGLPVKVEGWSGPRYRK